MKETSTTEKIDPLMRIQEEIKEVVRREQEYRQLTSHMAPNASEPVERGNGAPHDDHQNDSLSVSPEPVVVSSLVVNDESGSSMPSLALSVNSQKDEDHHSDDSGISASSSPVNGVSANVAKNNEPLKTQTQISAPSSASVREHRYIGPNCYNMTPEPPQQKLVTRTVSTPHLNLIKSRQFTLSPAHKGVMERFIASRGKLPLNSPHSSLAANKTFLSGKTNSPAATLTASPNTPLTAPANSAFLPDFSVRDPASIVIPTITMSPSVIERDAEGRPIRPGYVPVELKIQRELKDLKTRESELKKIRKIRQSTPDLLDSVDNDTVESDEEDSEVEHCYGPGKMRAAKSIGDMCDSAHPHNSISPSISPSPDFENKSHYQRSGGMRPAMSLAQLCDLDPAEAPSSHRLIAQWESLIQQNA